MRQGRLGLTTMLAEGVVTFEEDRSSADFEELAMPLLSFSYNMARWLARNDHDAEDLVQETYLKAYRSFHRFQPGTNFRAWFYRILHNTFLTSRTRAGARSSVPLDAEEGGPELAIENETPETIFVRRVDSQRLQQAIEVLPTSYRETLLFCEVEEMSYREIAEVLAIPIGTVMSRLARARRLLRKTLSADPDKPGIHDFSRVAGAHEMTGRGRSWVSPDIARLSRVKH